MNINLNLANIVDDSNLKTNQDSNLNKKDEFSKLLQSDDKFDRKSYDNLEKSNLNKQDISEEKTPQKNDSSEKKVVKDKIKPDNHKLRSSKKDNLKDDKNKNEAVLKESGDFDLQALLKNIENKPKKVNLKNIELKDSNVKLSLDSVKKDKADKKETKDNTKELLSLSSPLIVKDDSSVTKKGYTSLTLKNQIKKLKLPFMKIQNLNDDKNHVKMGEKLSDDELSSFLKIKKDGLKNDFKGKNHSLKKESILLDPSRDIKKTENKGLKLNKKHSDIGIFKSKLDIKKSFEKNIDKNEKTEIDLKSNQLQANTKDLTSVLKDSSDALSSAFSKKFRGTLGQQIVNEAKLIESPQGMKSIKLIIKPQDLGTVKINLNMNDNNIDAKVLVSNEVTRLALEGSLNNLSDALNKEGMSLSSFQVDIDNKDGSNKKQEDKSRKSKNIIENIEDFIEKFDVLVDGNVDLMV